MAFCDQNRRVTLSTTSSIKYYKLVTMPVPLHNNLIELSNQGKKKRKLRSFPISDFVVKQLALMSPSIPSLDWHTASPPIICTNTISPFGAQALGNSAFWFHLFVRIYHHSMIKMIFLPSPNPFPPASPRNRRRTLQMEPARCGHSLSFNHRYYFGGNGVWYNSHKSYHHSCHASPPHCKR